jgi:hypothetical protein
MQVTVRRRASSAGASIPMIAKPAVTAPIACTQPEPLA